MHPENGGSVKKLETKFGIAADMPELTPALFLSGLFASKAARDGTVIRRKVRDVERIVGRAAFRAELERRGFFAIENAGQFVVFCNREPIRLFVGDPASVTEADKETDFGFLRSFRLRKLARRP